MPIRLPRTTSPQEPVSRQTPASIVPFQPTDLSPAAANVSGEAAQLANQIYREERDREIETMVSDADLERAKRDKEALAEFTAQTGKNAIEQRELAASRIEENSKAVLESLTDPEARALFRRIDQARTLRSNAEIDAHYRRESRAHQVNSGKSRRNLLVRDFQRLATLSPEDRAALPFDEMPALRAGYRYQIEKIGQLTGADEDSIKLALQEADTEALGGAAEDLIAQERFGEALDLLGAHGDYIDAAERERLTYRATKGRDQAQVEEQGFRLADDFARYGAPVSVQLEAAKVLYDAKETTFPIYKAAVAEIRRRAEREHSDRAREGAEALGEAQRWSQLNRGSDLPTEAAERLRALGVDDDYQIWRLQGEHFITTMAGRDLLDTITPAELLRHREFDTLRKEHRLDLSEQHMAALQGLWEKAWEKDAQDAKAAGRDQKTLTTTQTVNGFLRERSHLFHDFDPLDKEAAGRIDAFEEAVERLLLSSGEARSQAKLDEAVRKVWNDGAVVDGNWLPMAMATKAERARMQSVYAPGPSGLVGVKPSDFDTGGRFEQFRNQDTGRPDFGRLISEVDRDDASIEDGLMVLAPGQEGVARKAHYDPATGEVLSEASGAVPSYQAVEMALVASGVEPTHEAIMKTRAEAVEAMERANASASKAAPVELGIRRDRFVEQLKGEWERDVLRRLSEGLERENRPHRKIADLLAEDSGAKVGEVSSGWFVTTKKGQHFIPKVEPSQTVAEVEADAFGALSVKHRRMLKAYGLNNEVFGGLYRPGAIESDPLWRAMHGLGPVLTPSAAVDQIFHAQRKGVDAVPEKPPSIGPYPSRQQLAAQLLESMRAAGYPFAPTEGPQPAGSGGNQ